MRPSRVATYRAWSASEHYQKREARALEAVQSALEGAARPVVAFSGGKDSAVLAHLALRVAPGLPLMHVVDPIDPFGILAFVRERAAAWGARLELAVPDLDAEAIWGRIAAIPGDVTERDPNSRKEGAAGAISGDDFFGPLERWHRAHGTDLVLLGLRAEESRGRALNAFTRGDLYTRLDGMTISQPISLWRTEDVWAYHMRHGLPWHPVYDCERGHPDPERIRLAFPIPAGGSARRGQAVWLRTHWPDFWRELVRRRPEMGAYA